MEDFRDLVSGVSCEETTDPTHRNPLGKFADFIFQDRSQKVQEFSRDAPQGVLSNRMENKLDTQTRNFLPTTRMNQMTNNFDPMSALDAMANLGLEDEFEDFAHRQHPRVLGPALVPGVPEELVKMYLKSFIDSARHQQTYRPMEVPELMGLTSTDKAKISQRSQILARQMYSDQSQEFIESQLNTFLSTLGPIPREDELSVEEFTSMSNQNLLRSAPPHHEFDRYWEQSHQSEMMARDFEKWRDTQEMNQYWEESHQADIWSQEFHGERPIERIQSLQEVTSSIKNIKDPKIQNSKFMQFISQIHNGEVSIVDNQLVQNPKGKTDMLDTNEWVDDFEAQFNPSSQWVKEFESKYNPNTWVEDFEKYADPQEWVDDFNDMWGIGIYKDYVFSPLEENPYMDYPDPLTKGIELFNDGRNSQAILALEAELQRNPENAHCWFLLGQAHAESDKDAQAISALLKAVELDPQNSQAQMSLAVSLTNDLWKDQALTTLRSWLEANPEYKAISENVPPLDQGTFEENHNLVTEMFIRAARMRPNDPDPNVQTALGLLFNLSREYAKAADCFQAALSVRANDYLLWNKLGATLANSDNSPEAINCYFNALKIKPSYVRARANLGISYMALKDYEQAAKYFLGALDMHPDAKHIWTTLQMCFMSMGRDDLVDKGMQFNVELFRDEFKF